MSKKNKRWLQERQQAKDRIVSAFDKINCQVHHIDIQGRDGWYLIITSPDFHGVSQMRRQTDVERKLKNYLTKKEIESLFYLTFTPEVYQSIEEDEE